MQATTTSITTSLEPGTLSIMARAWQKLFAKTMGAKDAKELPRMNATACCVMGNDGPKLFAKVLQISQNYGAI